MPKPSDLSLIVPIGPGDDAWLGLLPSLAVLPASVEILFAAVDGAPPDLADRLAAARVVAGCRWLRLERGRARQMNAAAARSRGAHLWFVHADTRFDAAAFDALCRSIVVEPEALHYFPLRFHDGPALMRLTECGVWFRSRALRLPFGDQAFCLSRALFERLGRFDESAAYGEDLLLVRAARRAGVPLRCAGSSVSTSARKYRDHGWCRTTARHLWLTFRLSGFQQQPRRAPEHEAPDG